MTTRIYASDGVTFFDIQTVYDGQLYLRASTGLVGVLAPALVREMFESHPSREVLLAALDKHLAATTR